jgi:phage baseplate assembly protein V
VKQQGVLIGTVKSVDDPQGIGQVQLLFPTLGITSNWAPVAVPLAGNSRGSWIMPELEDEVLVAFMDGNFNQPYVVGFLWNGQDKPPETDTKLRVIKTPGGHELRFEDKPGQKKVIVKTDGGLTITMDDSQQSIEIKGGGRAVTMQSGQIKIT